MKKRFLVILLSLLVTLAACGTADPQGSIPTDSTTAVNQVQEPEPADPPLSLRALTGKWEHLQVDGGECYVLRKVPYCEYPADPDVQFVDIYVPAPYLSATDNGDGTFICEVNDSGEVTSAGGTVYSASNAPVVLQNSIDAYKQSNPIDISDDRRGGGVGTYFDFVANGYVLVSIACRGVTSKVDGTAPAAILDLKAAVRMLKSNDDLIPGDMNKIIATGGSAGGGCASLLGASGNGEIFLTGLQEMGAVMDASDDIFAVAAYCPITNLDTADGAYEWLHITETQLAPVNHGDRGGRDDGIVHNDEVDSVKLDDMGLALQKQLYARFLEDLTEYGIDPNDYYEGFLEEINQCIQEYVKDSGMDAAAFAEQNGYLRFDGERVYAETVADFVENSMHRTKSVPSFDVLTCGSNENKLFDKEHFSLEVADVLEQIAADFPKAGIYLERYREQITEKRLTELTMMTPNAFLSGEEESDIAPHWRFRIGTNDGDLGASTAWLMTNLLQKSSQVEDVDYGLVWGKPHGTADYSFQNIREYIDSICAQP